jgi:hypothetical protein
MRRNSSFSLEKRGRCIYFEGMKKSSRLKTSLSLLLVSTLAATIMPTSVNAETTEFEDNVVTVEVDLGDGSDPELCEGFATLTVPGDTMTATLNRRVDGIVSPTMADVLGYYWGEYDNETNSVDVYDDVDLENTLNELNNTNNTFGWINFNAVTYPESATVSTLERIDYVAYDSDADEVGDIFRNEDLDEDGDIDVNDAPAWITETRRSYSTNWFTVSYDANDCVDSEDMGVVLVGRAPVGRAVDSESIFEDSELEIGENDYLPTLENRAEAYLKVKTNLIGGLISLPYSVAWDPTEDFSEYAPWEVAPVAFGDEGSSQMRSMMNIYGASPTGIYQANYFYQLEVNDEEYFYDEFGFFGCGFGGWCP